MAIRAYANGTKYTWLSTDTKPTKPTSADLGATLFETDTKREFIFSGEAWELKNQKTYEWLNQEITPGSFFSSSIPAAEFDLATAFVAGTGSIQISFRVALPNGSDYSWDPLGSMNAASMNSFCQANISGIEMIKLVAANNTEETVTANIYVYLGKRWGGILVKGFIETMQIVFTAIGGFMGYTLGGFDGLLYALLAFITLDYITGVMVAIVEKNLSSDIGFRGIFRKVLIFVMVALAHIVDSKIIQTGTGIRTAVILFYASNEGISILENSAKLGLPIPEKLKILLSEIGKSEKEK